MVSGRGSGAGLGAGLVGGRVGGVAGWGGGPPGGGAGRGGGGGGGARPGRPGSGSAPQSSGHWDAGSPPQPGRQGPRRQERWSGSVAWQPPCWCCHLRSPWPITGLAPAGHSAAADRPRPGGRLVSVGPRLPSATRPGVVPGSSPTRHHRPCGEPGGQHAGGDIPRWELPTKDLARSYGWGGAQAGAPDSRAGAGETCRWTLASRLGDRRLRGLADPG